MFDLNEMYFVQTFAYLLKAPREEADTIMKDRFPVPRLVVCDQHGSQVTFLSLSSRVRMMAPELHTHKEPVLC